ncbi:MAG: tetratricopeptide repeat protein [candidate division NC10 bacterium]|nr:tetratricopeptide repeat protein [candidate division NC10 bacterium]
MAKRKQRQPGQADQAPRRSRVPGIFAGRPTTASVVWLVAITLTIGVSAGYLASRFAGPAAPAPAPAVADPGTPWRARLLQSPGDIEALLGLAHVHLDQQRLDEAEAVYRQVLSKEPKNVEAIDHLGTVMLARGQADSALRQYDQALLIQPDYIHALWDKATLLQQEKKDYPAAIRVWESFLRAVGSESKDGKTAQGFIAEARQAMSGGSPVEKAFGGKP